MGEQPVEALTRQLLESLAAGDPHRAAALFAEQVDFDVPHAPGIPWIPAVRSRADLEGFFRGLSEHLEPLRFDVEKVVAAQDEAVILGTLSNRVRATAVEFESRFAIRVSEQNGLLTRYHLLEDSASVALAAGLVS